MTLETTLKWTRYDGTPGTLPEVGQSVLLERGGRVLAGAARLYSLPSAGRLWLCRDEWLALVHGDLWAPWPDAPTRRGRG